MRRRIGKKFRWLAAAAIACVLFAAFSSSAAAAQPAAAWQIHQASLPTNFVPGSQWTYASGGPMYEIFVQNVGGASSSGTVVTDVLPTGITPAVEREAEFTTVDATLGTITSGCPSSGQTVTCTIPGSVAAGGAVLVKLYVDVSSTAPTGGLNEVMVEGAAFALSQFPTPVSLTPAPFSIPPAGLGISAFDEGGATPAAGSHPFLVTTNVGITTIGNGRPSEPMRRVNIELPQGLVVNPQASQKLCEPQVLMYSQTTDPQRTCPPESQVGLAYLVQEGFLYHTPSPLYNMTPAPGMPAELAFELANAIVVVRGGLNGGFRLTAGSTELLSKYRITEAAFSLWGVPSDSRHDFQRVGGLESRGGEPNPEDCLQNGCSIEPSPAPFLTMPSSCNEALSLGGAVSSWQGSRDEKTVPFADAEGNPIEVKGCNALDFEPTISSKATTNVADSPSGLDFSLNQPQNQQLDGLATAILKDAKVTLPEGMTLNASAANGLGSCTLQQMGYEPDGGKIRFTTDPQTCPNAARLGSLEVKTPLLKEKLPGSIYLAKPYDNPFDNLTSVYLAVEDEERGIVAKLAGKVTPDPVTGRLTAVFTENPELPIEDIDLHFFNGAGAALTTPLTCGTKTTTSVLTPWTSPEGEDATPSDSFQTEVAAGGSGNCPSSEADAPNAPSFTAGTVSPVAGAYSPFVLRLARADGTQRLTGIDATLPKGLAAKFAGVPYCSETEIAQAQSRSNPNQGALEQANPSCPKASEVGTIDVGAGSGPTPVYVSGHAYLAGPYKGAPLSVVAITPAVAGPFDLGAVVVRTALYVDSETAQGHAVSDPFPSILQGVPLDLRSVTLNLDRPDFTLNPTSCEPKSLTGAATALTGQSALLSSPFQVGGCDGLKFKPKLAIRLKGGTKRNRFPALRAELTFPKGAGANIEQAQVTLPHSAFLEQAHIGTVCTRVQFAADQCPKASIYGRARAFTPLLDKPVEGPVYLRSSNHKLPDLVAALDGQIDVDLVGKVDTGKGGGIRNTFESAPDAPVTKFVLEMSGGKKSLLVNSENICRKPQRAKVALAAQNGKVSETTPLIANDCKKPKKKRHGKQGKR